MRAFVDRLDRKYGRWSAVLFVALLPLSVAGASLTMLAYVTVLPMMANYRECGTIFLCANQH